MNAAASAFHPAKHWNSPMKKRAKYRANSRYVDSSTIPYVGLPGRFGEETRLGDLSVVYRQSNGKLAFGVAADIGPANRIGLKEHKTVQQQGATIARLQKQIDALTAGLQKVSAQLELSKPAPQTALNDQ